MIKLELFVEESYGRERVVGNGKAWKKAGKVVTHRIVPRWSVGVVLNPSGTEESPGSVKQHQHPVLASGGFGLIGWSGPSIRFASHVAGNMKLNIQQMPCIIADLFQKLWVLRAEEGKGKLLSSIKTKLGCSRFRSRPAIL